MGKWDQGEYDRVCTDKFKRLFYASQDKGSVEYDIEAERGWKQFIKTLDPEKKTVQACFASLVAASRPHICPRNHVHRAGPNVHTPQAFRHYDTSNARTTRRTRLATMTRQQGEPAHEDPNHTNQDMAQILPPLQHSRPLRTPEIASGRFFGGRRAATERIPTPPYDAPRYDPAIDRLPSPTPVYLPTDDTAGLLNPYRAYMPTLYDRGENTPLSLSGIRGARAGRPGLRADDHPLDHIEDLDNTYPLFAPLDDAGPYPMEDMFDTVHENDDDVDEDPDDLVGGAPLDDQQFHPRGYTHWLPPVVRAATPDFDRRHSNIIDLAGSDSDTPVGSPDYTRGPASPTTGPEYTARARAEVDEQLALDTDPDRRPIGNRHDDRVPPPPFMPAPPPWSAIMALVPPTLRELRRQREDDDEDGEQAGWGAYLQRRPHQRARMDEGEPSEGSTQRARRSIPVESLLSGEGSGDDRRNGMVFDAESYINPNL